MQKLKLGLIEFGYYKKDLNSLSIIENVMEYLVKAEELGFSRFWITEHHNYIANSAWSSPEILLPIFLGITSKIKIGIAGVLINYHSPYRVALDYKLLSNLYSGRVDLGFANGTPPKNIGRLLKQSNFRKPPNDYFKNIKIINNFFYKENKMALNENIIIPPLSGAVPDMFILSSFFSDFNIEKAVELRLNFSKSLFHDSKSLIFESDRISRYKELFFNSYGLLPKINIAVPFICASSKKKAIKIALENEAPLIVNTLLGSPNYILNTLLEYQDKFQVDEFILYDKCSDHRRKLNSLELLSEKFMLLN
jgi:hypothetical protein